MITIIMNNYQLLLIRISNYWLLPVITNEKK